MVSHYYFLFVSWILNSQEELFIRKASKRTDPDTHAKTSSFTSANWQGNISAAKVNHFVFKVDKLRKKELGWNRVETVISLNTFLLFAFQYFWYAIKNKQCRLYQGWLLSRMRLDNDKMRQSIGCSKWAQIGTFAFLKFNGLTN